jgi:hypothetical protein
MRRNYWDNVRSRPEQPADEQNLHITGLLFTLFILTASQA